MEQKSKFNLTLGLMIALTTGVSIGLLLAPKMYQLQTGIRESRKGPSIGGVVDSIIANAISFGVQNGVRLILGISVAVGLGLLLAPKADSETRELISETRELIRERLRERMRGEHETTKDENEIGNG